MEGKNYTSAEINTLFSNSKATGESLYFVDEPKLATIAPDIILHKIFVKFVRLTQNAQLRLLQI